MPFFAPDDYDCRRLSLQEGVTSIKACCERLGVKEGDVKKAFVALTKGQSCPLSLSLSLFSLKLTQPHHNNIAATDGVIQQKKRGGRYEVSQSAASTAAHSFGSELRSTAGTVAETVVAAVTPNGVRPTAAFFAAAEEARGPADDIEEDLQDTPADAQPHSAFTKQHLRLQPGLAKKQRGAAAEAGAAVHVVEDAVQPPADLKRKAPQQEVSVVAVACRARCDTGLQELVSGLLSQSSDNGKRARKCSVIRDPINVSLQLRQCKQ